MASPISEKIMSSDENCGRRTRASRRNAGAAVDQQPAAVTTPTRTRRSTRKQTQEQLHDAEALGVSEEEHQDDYVAGETYIGEDPQNDIIRRMLAGTAQDSEMDEQSKIMQSGVEYPQQDVVETHEVIEQYVYEDQIAQGDQQPVQQLEEDADMYTVVQGVTAANEVQNAITDEKSSSFPFGTVGQSETSDDIQNEEEEERGLANNEESVGGVDGSLLASIAGDNANSLPSVGGCDENDVNAKREPGFVVQSSNDEQKSLSDSESLSSQPAIAEDLVNHAVDGSDATIVNAEMVSEDELPLPAKPEINDAEEVSDEELPAPARAELPADAEVISEDELPASATGVTDSPRRDLSRNKRKATDDQTTVGDKRTKDLENAKEGDTNKQSIDEQYNPMSPTGESNEETPAPPNEKRARIEYKEDSSGAELKDKSKDKEKDKERHRDKEREKDKEKEREKDKEKERSEHEKERKRLPDLDKYWRAVKDDPADFTGWTYLLQYVDNESDAEAAREAYDAFLSHYPYCYGYWRKYADYEKRKGIKANCNLVFERGLEAIPLSVDLWIHYLSHVKSTHADDVEYIRSQFERAIAACGLEFRSDKLWDAYIKWEIDAKRYQNMVQIYDRLLTIPTQASTTHFDNFQDLIYQHSLTNTVPEDELIRLRTELREASKSSSASSRSKHGKDEKRDKERERGKDKDKDDKKSSTAKEDAANDEAANDVQMVDIKEAESEGKPTEDLSDLSTLTEEEATEIKGKVVSMRRKVHKQTTAAVTIRWTFEEAIKRPYFHVKPLERCQLKNWKDYLDFEIEKGDQKRVIVLFERCLIACALYDEFWLKYIRYLETQVHLEGMAALTSDVYRRACQIHHPDKPSLHLMWSAFEECQNNFDKAAEILTNLEKRCPHLLQVAYRRVNLERRRGNTEKCRELYEHYISSAKNKTIAGSLAIKYARFLNKICHDLEGGLKVLRKVLEDDASNTRVALQMIDLALQRAEVNEEEIVQIMDKFMARDNIDPEQKVLFAQRKVEFLEDFGSTAKGLQDAQRALQLAMNKANEAKKKRETSPSRKSGGGSNKDSAASSATSNSVSNTYNNGGNAAAASASNYNYNSNYYGQQNAAASYQQQSYDYYNQWTYNSGYGGYSNQWSGYGSYY